MRVLIDTNVLISAALSANGTPYQAYVKAASYPGIGSRFDRGRYDRNTNQRCQ